MSAAVAGAEDGTVLRARGLVKRYGHVTALDGADFDLRQGEILAVIGDNGAGKSTLIKALSGALIPDAGEILLDGTTVKFHNPIDARRHGNQGQVDRAGDPADGGVDRDRKSTRLNSSHESTSRMPSSA